MVNNFSFDYLFVKRFSKLFIYANKNGSTFAILLFLLLLSILYEVAVYNIGMITASYYKILGDRDHKQFWIQTVKSVLLIVGISLIKSCRDFTASTLYIEWRKFLTQRLHSLYFMDITYYRVNVIVTEKDNFDQRITQDVDKMCQHLSTIIPNLLVSPFTIAFYSYRSFANNGFHGPVGCLLFFIIGTIVNKRLISPVVNATYLQEKCEGMFRYQHMHVRSNAESIAFLSGGEFEFDKSEKTLKNLISVQETLIVKMLALNLSVNIFDYMGSIMSFMILAVPLFAGMYDNLSSTELSELISQNTFVTMYLISSFTKIIDTSSDFSTIAATTHRIAEIIEMMRFKRFSSQSDISTTSTTSAIDLSQRIYFRLTNVTIDVPQTSRRLIRALNMQIKEGSNLLISGASGTCKTSVLRVLKGIWDQTNGTIERYISINDPNVALFLPQRPVLTTGSLLEQITYPFKHTVTQYRLEEMKNQIVHYMKLLDLTPILERINFDIEEEVSWNWFDCLSPGELQRISFVRLFFHRPVLAVLDEATSALSLEMEKIIYEECKRLKMTIITCGHRETLEQYHEQVLKIYKSDDFELSANQWIIERLQ